MLVSLFLLVLFIFRISRFFESSVFFLQLQAPLCEQTTSSCGPSASSSTTVTAQEPNYRVFGGLFLSRPIDIIALPNILSKEQLLAVSDSCGGYYF